jgi:hypothetical protein
MFSELPNTADPLSTLPSQCNQGEVNIDAVELELVEVGRFTMIHRFGLRWSSRSGSS